MSSYHYDKPITGYEDSPDFLNRTVFAEHLATILQIPVGEDCMTVSLEGEWGYGKTSIINLVKKALKAQKTVPIIVEYNPWLAGNAEALIQDFLVQFSSQLNMPNRSDEGLSVAKELLAYSELFNAMKFIPGVEPWASTVQSVFNVIGSSAKKISKLKSLDLLGRKNRINELLNNLGVSIVVVIDDIDRLTPDEAFQVIRLVKAVADFPSTSFLLSFDPVYLAGSLEKHGIVNSSQYLDKVIQLRVPLPIIAYQDLQKLADIELRQLSDKSLTESFEQDQDRLSYLYHKHVKYLIRSPRELKRIFNHLRFVLAQTEGNVCFTDLYCLSVIAIKSQKIYQSLKDFPEWYVGRKFDNGFESETKEDVVEREKHKRSALLNSLPEMDSFHMTGLLQELFPLLAEDDYSGFDSNYDQGGRVASEKRLYVALHYQVPSGYASDTDVNHFISGSIDRKNYLQKAISDGHIERLFELLTHRLGKMSQDEIGQSLYAVYDFYLNSDYVKECRGASHSFFGFDPYRNVYWITNDFIGIVEKKNTFIFGLLDNSLRLPIAADVARRIMAQQGKINANDPRLVNEKWLSQEESEDYLNQWSCLVVRELLEGDLVDSIYASHIYYVFCYVAPEKITQIFEGWLQEESGVEKIAKLIGRCGSDSSNGPYAEISEQAISKFLNYSLLKELISVKLEKSIDELPVYLKAIYLSIVTGDKYYLKDATTG
ncbi:KAP family P-loop NTPase fold protein [Cellvibrio fibrivorans]|uniref:KAP NTPase domain-containing protein n=1 Tax=Cellvibrio fibrivorans TaxID=126350 RepID=A0ABU1V4K1_9GAMM|nr:P-loop NTPase fold protein [Cellvibrio fibrivorans]MDR7092218.1 hypothetical protein [Cellvibrio fibrivorans]